MIPETLLEPMKQPSGRPPLFLRLTPQALDGILGNKTLKLEVNGASARLLVGDLELSGSFQPDPGSFEVFTKNNGTYRSQGQVEKRLVLRESIKKTPPAAATKGCVGMGMGPGAASGSGMGDFFTTGSNGSASGPNGTSLAAGSTGTRRKQPSPKHRPLVHVAALGAITPASLARTCKVEIEEARDFLMSFATPADSKRMGAGDPFILNDDALLYVRPWEYSYSEEDRIKAIDNCKAALDRMEIGPEHTARKSLKKPKVSAVAPAVVAASVNKQAKKPTKTLRTSKPVAKDTQTKESSTKLSGRASASRSLDRTTDKAAARQPGRRSSGNSSGASGEEQENRARSVSPQKRSVNLPQSPRKRPSIITTNIKTTPKGTKNLEKIAQKFHKTYSLYANLYKTIESTPHRNRDASQVKNLLEMHHELAEWKTLLWNSVDS